MREEPSACLGLSLNNSEIMHLCDAVQSLDCLSTFLLFGQQRLIVYFVFECSHLSFHTNRYNIRARFIILGLSVVEATSHLLCYKVLLRV